ncbi:hypothetical protein [Hymenobacter fodinae]|uniref:Uncharacterized protein n=1 Tax=Hymenobacter fodinae TaxID=2510796 RepID=A0A4Z0P363_9BACT|nr:hypothetical protein [Hymenobacter fodinae]TGE05559.1 hypothetical protein EU556_19865 [Hymenobacter fodinae]
MTQDYAIFSLCLGCLLTGLGIGHLLASCLLRKEKPLEVHGEIKPVSLTMDGPALRGVLTVDSYRAKRFC